MKITAALAFEDEGERCARLFDDPKKKVMIMGNHGVMMIGDTVADTFNRLYYFERAAETYIRPCRPVALCGCSPMNRRKDSAELEGYPEQDARIWQS